MIPTDKELARRYPILRFFEYDHLPQELQRISMDFRDTAWNLARELAYCAETSTGLRKLLEAKDCFVRASIPEDYDE